MKWSGVESTVDSSRVKSSPVESGGVEPSHVMEWSLVQCRGMESGQVGWVGFWSGRVGSSRVERVELSGAEWSQFKSSRVESWSGVEYS